MQFCVVIEISQEPHLLSGYYDHGTIIQTGITCKKFLYKSLLNLVWLWSRTRLAVNKNQKYFSVNDSVANRRVLTTWSYINLVVSISKSLLEILTYFSCDFNNIIDRRMQDISRFFDRISKKKDLSNNSNDGETSKKPREGSLNASTWSDIPHDLFTESLKDPECVTILLNFMSK